MSVKAKLSCISSEPTSGEQHIVKFCAVVSGSEENKSFSRWTPSLNLEMYISNETPAATFFQAGKEYYLTFEEA